MGLYGNPIFSEEGDYPEVVRDRVDANSQAEGFKRSRLPKFTDDEIKYIRGLWSLCSGFSPSYKYCKT
jgi:lactase-phlorizin hydrolase